MAKNLGKYEALDAVHLAILGIYDPEKHERFMAIANDPNDQIPNGFAARARLALRRTPQKS